MLNLLFSRFGRIGRGPFWLVVCLTLGLSVGLLFAITQGAVHFGEDFPAALVAALVAIPLWINFCNVAKRLHDRDKSAWYALHLLHPPGMVWTLVECGFLPGSPGTNAYGRAPGDPLSRPDAAHNLPPVGIAAAGTQRARTNTLSTKAIPAVNALSSDFPERKPTIAPIFGWRRK